MIINTYNNNTLLYFLCYITCSILQKTLNHLNTFSRYQNREVIREIRQ